jgi:hypothetical protein
MAAAFDRARLGRVLAQAVRAGETVAAQSRLLNKIA